MIGTVTSCVQYQRTCCQNLRTSHEIYSRHKIAQGTAGLSSNSLLISDRIVTPPEMARFITESLLFLPTCYLLTDHRQSMAMTQDEAYSGYLAREAANVQQLTKEEDSLLERKWNVCSPNAAGKADLLSALAMKQSLAMLAADQSSRVNTSLLTFWIGPSHSREAILRYENLMSGVVGKVMVMGRESREAHVRRLAVCDLSLDSFSLVSLFETCPFCYFARDIWFGR